MKMDFLIFSIMGASWFTASSVDAGDNMRFGGSASCPQACSDPSRLPRSAPVFENPLCGECRARCGPTSSAQYACPRTPVGASGEAREREGLHCLRQRLSLHEDRSVEPGSYVEIADASRRREFDQAASAKESEGPLPATADQAQSDFASSRRSFAPSPRQEEPCMQASVVGPQLASFSMSAIAPWVWE